VLVRTARGDVLLEERLTRGHDARLAPLVADALREAGLAPRELTRVVVATGPGSFTGARVGVAFARGLALALKIPAVGIFGLDALARTANADGLLVAAHDARRGELVWRGYRDGAPDTEPMLLRTADAIAAIDAWRAREAIGLVGSAAPLLAGGGRSDLGVASFALAALADLGADADPSQARPETFYHRPPDAAPLAARDPATP
jgi:tRNA threonylcarbamoyladenosine biosynthesis protein TsaB